ncbi:MAG: response regulator [Planctomycetes bacterium]|nr:response regulator [Planctomycetota bacterium]
MTTHKALVVEDDGKTCEAIDEILAALGHEYDLAGSLLEARKRLRTNAYSYILLDWEIPAKIGGLPRIQNAENFLDDLKVARGDSPPPVIVMMSPGDCKSDLALELIRLSAGLTRRGAADFIGKPFRTAGRTLDRVIKKLLDRRFSGNDVIADPKFDPGDEQLDETKILQKNRDGWLTVSGGAELLMDVMSDIDEKKARARVSKAAEAGKFKTNGQKGSQRRIDRDSFNTWRFQQRDLDLKKENENGDW